MTEREWLECSDPQAIIAFRRGTVSDRKLLLFAVECGRRCLQWEESRDWTLHLRTLDAWGEGQIPKEEVEGVRDQLYAEGVMPMIVFAMLSPNWDAANIAMLGVMETKHGAWYMELTPEARKNYELFDVSPNFDIPRCIDAEQAELAAQCATIHDIFGNPFRPVSLDPSWLTSDVVLLANGIYEEKAFDRMPILADALEDAGCENAELLEHCRGPGPHARGCWVLDLLLGKE